MPTKVILFRHTQYCGSAAVLLYKLSCPDSEVRFHSREGQQLIDFPAFHTVRTIAVKGAAKAIKNDDSKKPKTVTESIGDLNP